jgi:hypothetical protein
MHCHVAMQIMSRHGHKNGRGSSSPPPHYQKLSSIVTVAETLLLSDRVHVYISLLLPYSELASVCGTPAIVVVYLM